MPRQTAESYIVYPAIIPYPLLRFVAWSFKWFLTFTCAASIPYTLYNCSRIIKQVAHHPKQAPITPQHRRPAATEGGQRP